MQKRIVCLVMLAVGLVFTGCKENRETIKNNQQTELLNSDNYLNLFEDSTYAKKCIDSSKIQQDVMCIQVYEPVCGCDGKTYSNSCMAEISGVVKWTEGKCEESKSN